MKPSLKIIQTAIPLFLFCCSSVLTGYCQTPTTTSTFPKPISYFETDKRLNKRMTVTADSIRHVALWAKIKDTAGVRIEREPSAAEFDDAYILLAGKAMTTRAVMDAVAARVMTRWEKTEDKSYRLLVPSREMDNVHMPKTETEQERFSEARKFMDGLSEVPPELRDRILNGDKMEVADLPPSLQDPLLGMYQTIVDELSSRGKDIPFEGSGLRNGRMRLTRDPDKRFERWVFNVAVKDAGSSGWRFNNYEEMKKERENARRKLAASKGTDTLYIPVRNEITAKDAQRLSAMKRTVRLNLDAATLSEVLMQLHRVYNISFVCDPEMVKPARRSVNLTPMPLWDAMNRLTEIFPRTEWEVRKSGIIVVRGPENPARDKSKDRTTVNAAK